MRKLLVIVADQARHGAAPGPHTFTVEHETMLQKAAQGAADVVVAMPEEAALHYPDAEAVAAFPMRMPDISDLPQAQWLHSFSAGVDKILTPPVAEGDVL